jgi:predicted glycoside hydrolase/deacetylase ChbG (UPF0249 family)
MPVNLVAQFRPRRGGDGGGHLGILGNRPHVTQRLKALFTDERTNHLRRPRGDYSRRPDLVRWHLSPRVERQRGVAGWTELSCHPGYRSDDFTSVYLAEREEEVRTLTDQRIRETIQDLGIRLVSFGDLPSVARSAL